MSAKPRLAIVHYTAPPGLGGVEQVVGAQAQHLRAAGYDVKIVAGRGDAELIPELDSQHPEVQRLYARLSAGGDPEPEFSRLRARLDVGFAAALAGRDLTIVHNVLTMPFDLPATASLGESGRPLLAWTHDHALLNDRYRGFNAGSWPSTLLRRSWPAATLVAISETRRRELAAIYGDRPMAVVPNGLDPAAFLGLSAATLDLLERAGAGGADPLLIVPVRITRRKRLERALETAAALIGELPGLHLMVTGPLGHHDDDNVAYAAELYGLRTRLGLDGCVSFLHELAAGGPHPVTERNISELFRAADLVLLTSESEGFGLPVLEAGMARTPIVCAAIPVLEEVTGGAAELFPSEAGAAAVAAAVRRSLAERPSRLRSHVIHEYSWPAVLERTEAVIRTALGA